MGTKLYSASDEWILIETDQVSIGITKYAADQLGDIVFIDLPSVGQTIEKTVPLVLLNPLKLQQIYMHQLQVKLSLLINHYSMHLNC